MKKLFGILDKRPLIWLHYVLLTLVVMLGIYFNFFGFQFYKTITLKNFFMAFIPYFLLISLSDQLIHRILGVD